MDPLDVNPDDYSKGESTPIKISELVAYFIRIIMNGPVEYCGWSTHAVYCHYAAILSALNGLHKRFYGDLERLQMCQTIFTDDDCGCVVVGNDGGGRCEQVLVSVNLTNFKCTCSKKGHTLINTVIIHLVNKTIG